MAAFLARWIIRCSAWLAPHDERERWREEWLGEVTAAAGASGLFRRALGAPIDALFLRLRDVFDGSWSTGWGSDLRDVLREWRRAPVRTLTTAICLTVGLASSLIVFGVVNAMFAGEMPGIRDRATLARVSIDRGGYTGSPTADEFRAITADAFQTMKLGAASRTRMIGLIEGRPITVEGQAVSGGLFELLGTTPVVGRLIQPADDRADSAPAAVISHTVWLRDFGGRADVIGRQIALSEPPSRERPRVYEIVGVAPRGFAGVKVPNFSSGSADRAIAWVPVAHAPHRAPAQRAVGEVDVVARLTTSIALASEEMRPRLGAIAPPGKGQAPARAVALAPLYYAPVSDPIELALEGALMMSVPLTILLIVCVNVAGLRLAGATAHMHDLAIRASLGASRQRLVRQLAVEAATVATVSAVVAWAIAARVISWTETVLPISAAPDWRVLLFAILLSVGVTLIAGLAPALRVTGRKALPALAGGGASGASHVRLYRWLAIVQMALSLMLVGSGTLGMRGVQNLAATRFADMVGPVSQAGISFADPTIDDTRRRLTIAQLDQRIAAMPGVESVAISTMSRFTVGRVFYDVEGEGRDAASAARAAADRRRPRGAFTGTHGGLVSPSYFRTLGLDTLEGRTFTAGDGPDVAVVTREFREYLPADRSAIGTRLRVRLSDSKTDIRSVVIIGVVSDGVGMSELRHATARTPIVFLPFDVAVPPSLTLFARSATPDVTSAAMVDLLEDAGTPLLVEDAGTLRDAIDRSQQTLVWLARIMSMAGTIALAVAAMGLWAVAAVGVMRRRREFGIRRAIGAAPSGIARLLLAETARITTLGLAGGIIAGTPLLIGMRGELMGVDSFDPAALLSAFVILCAAALVATIGPALRAARVDPVQILRTE